jgi:hypothetical protein
MVESQKIKEMLYQITVSLGHKCSEMLFANDELSSYVSLNHINQQVDKYTNVGGALLFINYNYIMKPTIIHSSVL